MVTKKNRFQFIIHQAKIPKAFHRLHSKIKENFRRRIYTLKKKMNSSKFHPQNQKKTPKNKNETNESSIPKHSTTHNDNTPEDTHILSTTAILNTNLA